MNQADILKLAEASGNAIWAGGIARFYESELIYFAELCLEAGRQQEANESAAGHAMDIALAVQHEREECINACNDVGYNYRCLYKGWEPYKGNEDGRANPHIDGMSDGAYECAEAIRERNES